MSLSADPTTPPAGPRRRERPYLNWLLRSRDSWKRRAAEATDHAQRLRRQVRSLSASRDRWRGEALQLRRSCRQLQKEQEKNAQRS
jgi:hypothetical protein